MTRRKKNILSYFGEEQLSWVTREVGPPPFTVDELMELLRESDPHPLGQPKSIQMTLKTMVKEGLLVQTQTIEQEQTVRGVIRKTVIRYSIPESVSG